MNWGLSRPFLNMTTKRALFNAPSLQTIYGRNLSYEAYRRQWSVKQTAEELGTSEIVIHRIRQAKNRNIDCDLLARAVEVFECDFNALLLQREDLKYGA